MVALVVRLPSHHVTENRVFPVSSVNGRHLFLHYRKGGLVDHTKYFVPAVVLIADDTYQTQHENDTDAEAGSCRCEATLRTNISSCAFHIGLIRTGYLGFSRGKKRNGPIMLPTQ